MKNEFLRKVLQDSPRDGGCGMSIRPGYYSGRGATSSDLSSEKLERIYNAIEQNVSKDAANAFAEMVQNIQSLSATDFLLSLETLEAADWEFKKELLSNKKSMFANDDMEAVGMLLSAAGRDRSHDETIFIRREFLIKHNLKDPQHGVNPYSRYGRRW